MERVYENDIYSRRSLISAKPQYVVDSYLSAGIAGIVAAGLVYGLLASLISRVAERWFGGYTLGSGLVFASLFSVFWRGNSFEFFFGTIFWSFLTMFGLFQVGRRLKILIPTPLAAGNRRASAVAVPRSLPIRKRHDPPALLPARPPADTAAT